MEPIRNGNGVPILGPRNKPVERENPDHVAAPRTDSRTVPNLKFSFAAAHNRLLTGGWAREVTTRELPIATELAGVNYALLRTIEANLGVPALRRASLPSSPLLTGLLRFRGVPAS
jgi:hypothetical protein